MDRIQAYDYPSFNMPKKYEKAYRQALQELTKKMNLDRKVKPVWLYDVDLVKRSSSGYPHYKPKGDIQDKIFAEARILQHFMREKEYEDLRMPYCTPGTRGSSRPEDEEKTRLIWMYPAAMTVCEGVYAQPLIDAYYQGWFTNQLFLTGRESLDKHQKLASYIGFKPETIGVGADFKSFDTTRCTSIILDCFSILDKNIDHGYYQNRDKTYEYGGLKAAARSKKAFSNVVQYFIHTPMILPNGRIIQKHIGVPSGSHLTNLIDGMVNWLMLRTFTIFEAIKVEDLKVNGDDSAMLCGAHHSEYIVPHLKHVMFDAFSMTLNTDKTVVASTPSEMHMSGVTWRNLVPTRTSTEWFTLALNPKGYVRDHILSFQRLTGIGYCGGFYDPTYCAFYNYFQRGWNCRTVEQTFDWSHLRWLKFVFGDVDLPIYFKSTKAKENRLVRFSL